MQDIVINNYGPRAKLYNGWSNYMNVKSGKYNRQICYPYQKCENYPQTPGVFNLTLDYPSIPTQKNFDFNTYQQKRMCNCPGTHGTAYVNYLNTEHYYLQPKEYIKGYWPSERLIYTNTPTGCVKCSND